MADPQLWYSISVTVPPEASEAVEYAFNSVDALGTEINHLRKQNAESVRVVGYFNELPEDDRFEDELHYALSVYGFTEETATTVERSEIANTDWLAEWKKHWKPSNVGTFIIAPPWSEVDETGKILIRIEPNMAFGTGTHETTQLCLNAIEKYYEPGDSFLDVGTGTGILAIAAAKLNLRSVAAQADLKFQISDLKLFACDTDVDSIAIAKENAGLNDVDGMIDFAVASISDHTPVFDFVCANLTLDVIEPLLPILLEKTSKVLVLSGILTTQNGQILRALEAFGITAPEVNEAGEWLSVTLKV
jgi:ribosomal protein L11 methyltransferase